MTRGVAAGFARGAAAALVAMISVAAMSADTDPHRPLEGTYGNPDFDPGLAEKWQEAEAKPPAWPEDRRLLAVPKPSQDSVRVYLDSGSLTIGPDWVTRYALVVESSTGARNVYFEATRCATKEFKTYAIGTGDKRWQLLEKPQWQEIPYGEFNAYRYYLYKHYLCEEMGQPRDVAVLVRMLRYGAEAYGP